MGEGGYDYQFLQIPPDSLKCLICLLVVREAKQHSSCGKLFCNSCITKYRQPATKNDCPCCRQPLSTSDGHSTLFQDLRSDQEVKSLKVCCRISCGWTGELGTMEQHINKECKNALVPCPNKCHNGNMKILRCDLSNHLQNKCGKRKVPCSQCKKPIESQGLEKHITVECPKRKHTCPKCGKKGRYDEITTTHMKVCPKATIQCPKCSLQILRTKYSDHPIICKYEPISCKYSEFGCSEKPLRKELRSHERNTEYHLALATRKIQELTLKFSRSLITFKLSGFEDTRAKNDFFGSPHFYTSSSGYKLCVGIEANGQGSGKGTHVSVYACLMKGDNDDSLTWPFTGTVTFELLNQLEDKNHHKMTSTFPADDEASKRVVDEERAKYGWGQPLFISHDHLAFKPESNCQYLKDDTLVFRVSAKAPDHKPWLDCTQ